MDKKLGIAAVLTTLTNLVSATDFTVNESLQELGSAGTAIVVDMLSNIRLFIVVGFILLTAVIVSSTLLKTKNWRRFFK